ncbi:hypothetical protein [Synechococcus sp. GFB01]|uniref:hypothetical protein n=1 Tax=Synechococcus sp. GFB01 TaxID=1662190 RepID=UPI00064F78D3|nr:hypothetical protein [Synechococcus sp. GFB01]KMM16959.1 hypothetical protein SYNGFB01_07375 [Synechococcus sp. GFB01]
MSPIALLPAAAAVRPQASSLVGSLCREMDRLRSRAAQVSADLARCQSPALLERLRRERAQLADRRREVQQAARSLRRLHQLQDPLALAFLEELARRPIAGG